jgi:hypothetical protein
MRNLVQQGLSTYEGNGEFTDTVFMAAEVVDVIIDHLHDCKSALQSCALVSRTWLPASHLHLFRRIELGPKSPSQPHCCHKLYAIIQRSPHIVSNIRELRIHEGTDLRLNSVWVNDTPCLALLLNSLTHLNTLHLKKINWVGLTSELRGALRHVVVSNPVSNFEFENCHIPFSSLLSIFNMCSTSISLTLIYFNLVDLVFPPGEVEAVEKEEAGYVGLENKCRFHDLRIFGAAFEVLLWLNDAESGPDLSHLRTLYCGGDHLSSALRLRLGGHLQHLCLHATLQEICVSNPPYLMSFFIHTLIS